jgi:hypothetical protein
LQHLLGRAVWDADGARDDVRSYVLGRLADPGTVLVVDDTGDLKMGTASVGVQRQYSGTAGRIENCQVAVFLTDAAPGGHAFVDRRLYLLESWSTDPDRRELAGVPDDVTFATKPALASQMIESALMAGAPARWVAGDEVYGADPGLRITCRRLGLSYVLAIGKNRTVTTHAGTKRADEVTELIPPDAWVRLSAGEGSKGHRWYSWAIVDILPEPDGPDLGSGHHTCSCAATTPPASLPGTGAGPHARSPCATSCTSPAAGGPSRRTSRPPRATPGWTSTRSAAGTPGTGGQPWPCSPTPSSPSWPP